MKRLIISAVVIFGAAIVIAYNIPKIIVSETDPSTVMYFHGFGLTKGSGIFGLRCYKVIIADQYGFSEISILRDHNYNPFSSFYVNGRLRSRGICWVESMGFYGWPLPNLDRVDWSIYWKPNGDVSGAITNGCGFQMLYSTNGAKLLQAEYVDHERRHVSQWYPSGKLKSYKNYTAGVPSGESTVYYPSGNIMLKEIRGAKSGDKWLWYDEKGERLYDVSKQKELWRVVKQGMRE